jgi:hypothetical protein
LRTTPNARLGGMDFDIVAFLQVQRFNDDGG